MKKLLTYLIYLAILPVLFYWLTGGEFNPNLLEVWHKAMDKIDYWYDFNGWHRVGIIYSIVSPVIIWILWKIREK